MTGTKNLIIVISTVIVCLGAFFLLIANTSTPVFTVKELIDHSQPDSLMNKNIQVIGVVEDMNSTGFYISDPEDVDNTSLLIYVNSTNVIRPSGFEIGKTVLVEGELLSIANLWKFKARLISTKCPSKYT
ncbi:MAG: cytochrome c maturation protein CcmE [Candidatus Thorarchaeota archaeon]